MVNLNSDCCGTRSPPWTSRRGDSDGGTSEADGVQTDDPDGGGQDVPEVCLRFGLLEGDGVVAGDDVQTQGDFSGVLESWSSNLSEKVNPLAVVEALILRLETGLEMP